MEWLKLGSAILLGVSSYVLSAQPQSPYQQGVLVEANSEYPCAHECGPFEPVYFSFCIQSGKQVLLARLFNTRFNYDPNRFNAEVGKTVQFRADDKHLWIVRPDGKEFRVQQNYSDGYYLDDRCVAELHRHILTNTPEKTRPQGVDADAVYVPLTAKVGYWTKCFLAADRAITCFARGSKGGVLPRVPDLSRNGEQLRFVDRSASNELRQNCPSEWQNHRKKILLIRTSWA